MSSDGDADQPRRATARRGRRGPGGASSVEDGLPAPFSVEDGGPDDAFPAGSRPGSGVGGPGSGRAGGSPPRDESEVAREICLRQLAVRPRTRSELEKVLIRKEISEEVIAEVLDRYDEVGIIDDAAFARAWVSSRHQGRGLARRALANELRQRGVDAEVAGEALEAVDDESEAETARALVDRKLRTARGAPDAIFRRLVAMLARKGYPAGVAIGAVKDALAARDAEAAEFAEAIDADALADEADGLPS
jgi:regulatory protein